jgi:hypothetical protein
VYRSMNPPPLPAQRFVSTGLEGEVGEVVGGELKTLLRGFGPNMLMMTSSEKPRMKASHPRSSCEDIGMRRPGEGAPGDGLSRPGVDEAEGAEMQGGLRSQRDPATVHLIH